MALMMIFLLAFFLIFASGIGVTMGAHRLWSHRSFKATPALRLVLLWLHTLAGQVKIIRMTFFIIFNNDNF